MTHLQQQLGLNPFANTLKGSTGKLPLRPEQFVVLPVYHTATNVLQCVLAPPELPIYFRYCGVFIAGIVGYLHWSHILPPCCTFWPAIPHAPRCPPTASHVQPTDTHRIPHAPHCHPPHHTCTPLSPTASHYVLLHPTSISLSPTHPCQTQF
jgi:hypothetical protein